MLPECSRASIVARYISQEGSGRGRTIKGMEVLKEKLLSSDFERVRQHSKYQVNHHIKSIRHGQRAIMAITMEVLCIP